MANTFNIKGAVHVDGVKQATDQAKGLNLELDKISKPRVVKAAAAPKSMAYAKAASAQENKDYGVARTAREGGTGASARDFARQAEGLGGLVRLYATYAANIFAVGAAFRALSGAMDTDNLIKGLDQLGSASGKALGSLSKQLVMATDGAISLRDAMSSVAKASSSGMANDDILRMGKVAKQASQALGIDMADAVNRITRGITKLEPELLDELGIFTRVDMSTREYAKSVGKATSAITDFEKRQAFANAVLSEGEKKFGALELDANPYTKLLATIQDLSYAGLSLVNKVLAPMVSYLGTSPVALTAVLAGIASVLVKQALPAIGEFKSGLASAADMATELSKRKAGDALAARQKLDAMVIDQVEASANEKVAIVDLAEDRIREIEKNGLNKRSAAYKLLKKDISDVTEADYAAVEKRAQRAEKAGNVEQAGSYRDAIFAVKQHKAAEEDLIITKQNLHAETMKAAEGHGVYASTLKAARNAEISANKATMISNAAYNGSLIGVTGSFRLLREEVAKQNLTGFTKYTTLARGGAAALGGAVSTLAASLGSAMFVIGIVVTGLSLLHGWLSSNTKQLGVFNSSLTAVEDASKNLSKTLDTIYDKKPGDIFNAESLEAAANAIAAVTDSTQSLVKSVQEVDKASGKWDRFIDGFKTLWGGDVRTKFAEGMTETVFGTFDKLVAGPEVDAAKAKIASILEIDPRSSREQWEAAFAGIAQNAPKLKAVVEAQKEFSKTTSISAAKSKEFNEALKTTNEAYKTFANSFKLSNPVIALGESLVAMAAKTALAMDDPISKVQKLMELSKDTDSLKLFGESDQALIKQYALELESVNSRYTIGKANVKAYAEELKALQAQVVTQVEDPSQVIPGQDKLLANIAAQEAKLNKEKASVDKTKNDIATLSAKFPNVAANQLAKGAEILEKGIVAAMSKGSTAFAEAVLAATGDLPGMAAKREKIELSKLSADSALLNVQLELVKASVLNSAQLKLNSARLEQSIASSDARGPASTPQAYERLASANAKVSGIQKQVDIINMDPKKARAAVAEVRKELAAGNESIREDAVSLFNYLGSISGIVAQQQAIGDQARAIRFNAIIAKVKEEFTEQQKLLKLREQDISLASQEIALAKQNANSNKLELVQAEHANSLDKINLQSAQKQLALAEKMAVLTKARTEGGGNGPSEVAYQGEMAKLAKEQSQIISQATIETSQLAYKTSKDIYDITVERLTKEREIADIQISTANALVESQLNIERIKTQAASESGQFTENYQASLDYELSMIEVSKRAQMDADAEILANKRRMEDLTAQRGVQGADIAQIDSVIAAAEKESRQKVSIINKTRDAELAAIKQVEKARKKQSGFDSLIKSFEGLGEVFDRFGNGMANVVSAFAELNTVQEQNINTLSAMGAARDQYSAGTDEYIAKDKEYNIEKQKGFEAEMSGAQNVAGAAKKMFKEKTVAYKLFAAVEKGIAIVKLALMAKELAMDGIMTVKAMANSAARTGAGIIEASVKGVLAILNQGNGDPYTAFARMAAMGVAVAAILSVIGGKSGKVPGGASAKEQQAVQGTGQDYVNGKLTDTGFGQLGDSSAKSTDIVDSIELLSKYSKETLRYDNLALNALKAIEQNTKVLAAKLFNVQGLVGGQSAFGTEESSGIKATAFGFRKKTVKILDTGIQAMGTLFDMINNPAKTFQQYETVQKSSKNIFGGGSTSVKQNTKSLDEEIAEILGDMFRSAAKAIVEMGKVFNMDTTNQLDEIMKNTSIDFKVSAKGLKGEELIEAIAAEIGTTTNAIVAQLYPFIEKFQQVGEGLLTTLTRINTEINTVNGLFLQMGIDFAKSFTQPMALMTTSAETARVAAAKAQLETEQSTLSTLEASRKVSRNSEEYSNRTIATSEEVKAQTNSLTAATEEYNAALEAENNAKYKIIEENIRVYDSLVLMGGGLEEFTEKANFFIDKFVPAAVQVEATTKAVADRMKELGYASVDTHDEFYRLVTGLDLSTEAGREAYTALMDIAPAFDAVKESTESMLSEYGFSVSGFKDTIRDAMLGRLTEEEIGTKLADMVIDGVYNAIAGNFAQQITDIFVNEIIAPAITAAAMGGSISAAVSSGAIDAVVAKATEAMRVMEQVLNNPDIQGFLSKIQDTFKGLAKTSTKIVRPTSVRSTSMNKVNEEAAKIAQERIGLENKLLQLLGDTEKLRERELATLNVANRALQLRIWAIEDAQDAMDKAFSALERAVDAERKAITTQIETTTELRDKLQSVFDVLKTNIDELLNISAPTLREAEAKSLISTAIQSGIMPDSEKLSEAIGVLRSGIDTAAYRTGAEQKLAGLTLANELKALSNIVEPQLSAAELTLKALEDQLLALDAQLELAQAQLDAIKGVDTSVISVAAAVTNLSLAMANYTEEVRLAKLDVIASSAIPTPVAAAASYSSGGSGHSSSGGSKAPSTPKWPDPAAWTWQSYISKNADIKAYYDSNKGALDAQFGSLEKYASYHFGTFGQKEGRRFEDGGKYPGGIALVGEKGPELINFRNPGMVYTAAESQNLMNNSGNAEQEILTKELIQEVKQLRFEAQATAVHTNKTLRLLDRVTRNGKSLLVTNVPA